MSTSNQSGMSALADVVLAISLYFGVRAVLTSLDFGAWQKELTGSAPISSVLAFFAAPLLVAALRNQHPDRFGLGLNGAGSHLLSGLRAAAFLVPATFLFPVVSRLGFSPMEWNGASILTAGFLVMGLLAIATSRPVSPRPEAMASATGSIVYFIIIGAGLAAMASLYPVNPLAARILGALLFVAFLEEFFFRGFLQARLNTVFGTPFQFRGVQFGLGLFVAAILFGLFHPISAAGAPPWPWALWTTAFGVVMGFLRERTGSIVAPSLAHGIVILPAAFSGS